MLSVIDFCFAARILAFSVTGLDIFLTKEPRTCRPSNRQPNPPLPAPPSLYRLLVGQSKITQARRRNSHFTPFRFTLFMCDMLMELSGHGISIGTDENGGRYACFRCTKAFEITVQVVRFLNPVDWCYHSTYSEQCRPLPLPSAPRDKSVVSRITQLFPWYTPCKFGSPIGS